MLEQTVKRSKFDSLSPPATWWHRFLKLGETARFEKATKIFVPVEGKPAIVSAAACKELRKCPNERELCRFIAALVQPLVPHLYVVSIEDHQWLSVEADQPLYDQKPDLVFAPKPFLHFHYPKEAKLSSRGLLQAGVPVKCTRLWDSLIIGAGKMSLDDRARRELLDHVTLLSEQTKGEIVRFRAFLFSKMNFELWELIGNCITIRTCASWTDPGSEKLVKKFFRPKHFGPMSTMLDTACRRFEVSPVDQSSVCPTSFLGAGAFGVVFRVCDSEGQYALKLSSGKENVVLLKSEFEMMEIVHTRLPHLVVRPIFFDSWFEGEVAAGAILIAPVLSPCRTSLFKTNGLLSKAFDALFELHLEGFVHGDARIANILFNPEDRSFVWCDLAHSDTATKSITYQRDVASFAYSFLLTLPAEVQTMISKYNPVTFLLHFALLLKSLF